MVAGLFVQIRDDRFCGLPIKKGMKSTICGISFGIVGNILKGRSGCAADIDNDLFKIFTRDMMPHGQFADPAEPGHPQFQIIGVCAVFPHVAS